ncbi:MAG: MFS transporter, partial [Alphaproteobacteria bacterium]
MTLLETRSDSRHHPDGGLSVGATAVLFAVFGAGYFLSYLFRTVNAVLAPDLVRTFGLDAGDLGVLTAVYFITFAAAQLPLGLLLDRFGPRRVEAALLLFAAAGAWIFAGAETLGGLIIGRALIGFGVSACLMAALKALAEALPRRTLPLANGGVLLAGGLGAVAAAAPVQAVLTVTDWRGLFLPLSGLAIVIAVALMVLVRDAPRSASHQTDGVGDLLRGLGRILSSRWFWRVTPLTMLSQGTFMAVAGLWIGPWLRDVSGLERAEATRHITACSAAMAAGFILFGALAVRLDHRGVPPLVVAGAGMFGFMVVQAALVLDLPVGSLPTWLSFGLLGSSGVLGYAVLSQGFPSGLAGRTNTALNLFIFVVAFLEQYGFGLIIHLWPNGTEAYAAQGYRLAEEGDLPRSIGRLSAFHGNVGVMLRAYIYLRMTGLEGMRRVSAHAALNANSLMARLRAAGFQVAYPERRATHEFIVSWKNQARERGVTALDVAKRLLDHGFYAPTIYFPLLVPECLLIEPTETETRQELDRFVEALIRI